jgi:hypothetical protein
LVIDLSPEESAGDKKSHQKQHCPPHVDSVHHTLTENTDNPVFVEVPSSEPEVGLEGPAPTSVKKCTIYAN